ncbi:MAG: endonuclease Q family protein, partial [Deltaproteobacteria bacterium]
MIYFADLHLHSRFSRATSRDCNLMELARWASLKGIRVLATGDFTHPEWSREIRESLEPTEDGLFRLKSEHVPESEPVAGGFSPADVRFMLNVEISSIYKKRGATRKVHNLVFMPDLDAMDRFNARLDRIGNIKSDGRPILGLDSRDLFEIALESSADSFLVPAHIWTPWFSVLGSRSGFDSLEECFEDLTGHIFALETGLSSDPAMNHRVGSLDRYTLISNSDTHSPANLGREANVFEGRPGYVAIREAIRAGGGKIRVASTASSPLESIGGVMFENEPSRGSGEPAGERAAAEGREGRGFLGTIEFFPEEGKYHLDGHRKCSMRLDPHETEKLDGRCPVCGKTVTVGVMNRVMELADRETAARPAHAAPFWSTIPLAEIVGQALGVGPKSKKVALLYRELLKHIGPELMILWARPIEEIARHAPGIIVEGISRVRKGQVSIQAGFDGEYGTVRLFTADERDLFQGQATWMPVERLGPRERPRQTRTRRRKK